MRKTQEELREIIADSIDDLRTVLAREGSLYSLAIHKTQIMVTIEKLEEALRC